MCHLRRRERTGTSRTGGVYRYYACNNAMKKCEIACKGRSIRMDKLDTLVAQLASRDLKASAHVADIREPDAVNALFDTVWVRNSVGLS